jgi:hypothetical protein
VEQWREFVARERPFVERDESRGDEPAP